MLVRLHQAQMALRQREVLVPGNRAQHRQADTTHGFTDARPVPLAGHAVQQHARDLHPRRVADEAAGDGGGGLGLARNIQGQQHRQAEAGGQVRAGAAAARFGGDAVEQAHGRFHDQEFGLSSGLAGEGGELRCVHGPAVEIETRRAGGGRVKGRVDIVGPGLGGAHHNAAAPKGRQHSQGQGGLARARPGRADDEPAGAHWRRPS